MAKVVDIVIFRTARSIADLAAILGDDPLWRLSSHAHEHCVDFGGGVSHLAASVHGVLAGAVVRFEIDNGGPNRYWLRATLTCD